MCIRDRCVCVCVSHVCEPCKNGWIYRHAVGSWLKMVQVTTCSLALTAPIRKRQFWAVRQIRKLFKLLFFTPSPIRGRIFNELYVIWRVYTQRSVFWGSRWYCSTHRVCFPKAPFWERKKGFSSLTRKILKLIYYRNYCTDSNQTLHCDKDSSWVVQTRVQQIQNGGWHHFQKKIEKSPYLSNGLTDLYEIWHSDAYWVIDHVNRICSSLLNFS